MDLLFPEQASTWAGEVDAIYFVIWALTFAFSILVATLVTVFILKYRRGTRADRSNPKHHDVRIELLWSIIPLCIGLVIFAWSAKIYARTRRPPANAMEIFVVGKRWMWHMQHANGVRENNELHVPVGKPVKLTMISQDVIHSFYVPAFRIKQDVLPGRYTQQWFQAIRPGTYKVYCSQYCGTDHSRMTANITVMEPRDFQQWLAHGGSTPSAKQMTLEGAGEELFNQFGCNSCHSPKASERGASLHNLYMSTVKLEDGRSVVADDAYIRESILRPNEKVVKGFWPIMPAYEGQLSEEQVLQLIAYIKTQREQKLGAPKEGAR